ncbi:MAG: DUF2231 domain-containing protein [Nocardioides sp.]
MSGSSLAGMEIAGLPAHPLVVHAVVVIGPLAALAALAFAVLPRGRWLLRWPLAVATLVAVVAAVLAAYSGQQLLDARGLGQLEAVRHHRQLGLLLRNVMLGFGLAVALGLWRLGGPSALASGRGGRPQRGGAVDLAVSLLVVLAALAVLGTVALAGDSGARAVWG